MAPTALVVYRKHKNSSNDEWHFHTQCSVWPESNFIQVRFLNPGEAEPVCGKCMELESAMFGSTKQSGNTLTAQSLAKQTATVGHGMPRPPVYDLPYELAKSRQLLDTARTIVHELRQTIENSHRIIVQSQRIRHKAQEQTLTDTRQRFR
jgi:hypothetical protein